MMMMMMATIDTVMMMMTCYTHTVYTSIGRAVEIRHMTHRRATTQVGSESGGTALTGLLHLCPAAPRRSCMHPPAVAAMDIQARRPATHCTDHGYHSLSGHTSSLSATAPVGNHTAPVTTVDSGATTGVCSPPERPLGADSSGTRRGVGTRDSPAVRPRRGRFDSHRGEWFAAERTRRPGPFCWL